MLSPAGHADRRHRPWSVDHGRALAAPDPVPCVVAPPDFVGVGAERCGTTRWYELLTRHPDVFHHPGRPKELHYFAQAWREDLSPAEAEGYHRLFRRPAGMVAGEWTPRYMYDFWIPAQLARVAPDTRLLVLLRDPMTRYQSGLQRLVSGGVDPNSKDAQETVEKSLYGVQLARLLRHFPRERIRILQFEACTERPRQCITSTLEFLGLDPSVMDWTTITQVVNANGKRFAAAPCAVIDELLAAFHDDFARVEELFPGEIDPDLWPSVGKRRKR